MLWTNSNLIHFEPYTDQIKNCQKNSQFRSLIVLMKWKNKHIFILYGTRTFYDDEIKENFVV